jgi:hypothetical protein
MSGRRNSTTGIVDVTREGGDSFSLEAADGVRFVARSRLFTDVEFETLRRAGPPPPHRPAAGTPATATQAPPST